MIPKEKAKELINKFECYVDYQGDDCFNEMEKMLINAKNCALIAVDDIIENLVELSNGEFTFIHNVEYWQEVKQEIEKI